MLRFLTLLLTLAIGLAACSDHAPRSLAERKAALRQFLNPRFDNSSVASEHEEDFCRIVEAFARGRSEREFVSALKFVSPTEALLWFSDGGMHGGGTATMKKVGDKWVIEQKSWFL